MNSEKANGMMEKVAGKAQEIAGRRQRQRTLAGRRRHAPGSGRAARKIRRRPELRRQHDEEKSPRRVGTRCRRRSVGRPAVASPLMGADEQTAFP